MTDALFANNLRWAASKNRSDPDYFRRLAAQQGVDYFWIGCSDCRVAANEIVGLDPGRLFVHRNVANLAPGQDLNFLSALQFAVDVLSVRHIIVCGHYGCAGLRAALSEEPCGLVDNWLQPVRVLTARFAEELDAVMDADARANDLCEKNVVDQVMSVAANPLVHAAWRRGQELSIHGWVYSVQDGLLRDLEANVGNYAEAARAIGLAAKRGKMAGVARGRRRAPSG